VEEEVEEEEYEEERILLLDQYHYDVRCDLHLGNELNDLK
jgi:hypothetical protein